MARKADVHSPHLIAFNVNKLILIQVLECLINTPKAFKRDQNSNFLSIVKCISSFLGPHPCAIHIAVSSDPSSTD